MFWMEEETLKWFMENRGIPQEIIQKFEEEKIDKSTIILMDEDALKGFIPKYGDRIAIRDFCKRQVVSKKNSLIEALRLKINKRGGNEDEHDKKIKSFRKKTRIVELGWSYFNEKEKRYKQLRKLSGGGTRKIEVERDTNCQEILQRAKEILFPNRVSIKGPLDSFEVKLLDFKNHEISSEMTVDSIFESTTLTKLKFYMGTKLIETALAPAPTNMMIPTEVPINNSTVSASSTTTASTSMVIDMREYTISDDDSDTRVYNESESSPVEATIDQISDCHVPNESNLTIHDGDFELECLPRLPADAPQMNIYINRNNCVTEMLKAYQEDESIIQKFIHVEFLGEPGEDFGGLTKELFNVFWKDIETQFFIGEDIIVPNLPLHRKKEKNIFIVIGRILCHMILQTGELPIKLSRCVYLSFTNMDISSGILLKDFMLFLSGVERALVRKALQEFKMLCTSELETITNIFTSYNYMAIPKENNFNEQLIEIATEVLVERPKVFVDLIKQGLPTKLVNFWINSNEHNLTFILSQQRPTLKKLLECSKTEDILNNDQMRVFHYFKMYLQELNSDSMLQLLFFITGSVMMPLEIKVTFNALSGQMRRPISHTCSDTLELSCMYASYQEFKKEMNTYLSSEHSYLYTQI